MDLYYALAALNQGKLSEGVARLKDIAGSDTYEDVKADALYHLGIHLMRKKPPERAAAFDHFVKSVELYPRDRSCLAAGKCGMELKKWDKARDMLERATRDFPTGRREVIEEARKLLPVVLKEIAKLEKDKG
jgi:hypothetical protein